MKVCPKCKEDYSDFPEIKRCLYCESELTGPKGEQLSGDYFDGPSSSDSPKRKTLVNPFKKIAVKVDQWFDYSNLHWSLGIFLGILLGICLFWSIIDVLILPRFSGLYFVLLKIFYYGDGFQDKNFSHLLFSFQYFFLMRITLEFGFILIFHFFSFLSHIELRGMKYTLRVISFLQIFSLINMIHPIFLPLESIFSAIYFFRLMNRVHKTQTSQLMVPAMFSFANGMIVLIVLISITLTS
ncbi:MAG: hypothetical protein Kow00108_01920 [Calditrichia bacterium]